jgi:hypothetical protein
VEENQKRGWVFASLFFGNHTGNVPEHQKLATATTHSFKPNALSSPVKEEEGGGVENRRQVEKSEEGRNDGLL